MKGKLVDQPLVELTREISVKSLSGTLRLEHERAQTAVYFENGKVVYAASNLRTLRLREYLTKRALVSESVLVRFQNNRSDLDFARALAASGTLRLKDVEALLAILVTDVLRVALLWTEGLWEFNERARLANPVNLSLDTGTLLREAAQRMPSNFVSQRFRNAAEMISRASDVSPTSNLTPGESFILSRLDHNLKLADLIMLSGLPEIEARRAIYGLALSGLARREYWQNAFRTESPQTGKEQVAASAVSAAASDQPEQSDNWVSASIEDEGINTFLQRLRNAANYYEVIELPLTAQSSEIKEAYYALARRYHPDRFHLKSGTKLHAELSSAFARVTQAYETLTNPNARSIYDQTLQRSNAFSKTENPNQSPAKGGSSDDLDFESGGQETEIGRADYHFREGLGAFQQGRISVAIQHLSNAARLQPQEARYRAHYGRALAADANTRRLAENEIQAAVKLAPSDITFRTMLAELYFQLKFHRRARTELDRALALDPQNAAAHALLRKLEKSRKVG